MKSLARMELKPGMILGEDVECQGNIIYKAGSKLDETMIDRMKRYGVMCATVMEDIDFAKTHLKRIRYTDEFKNFTQKHNECLLKYKQLMLFFSATGQQIPNKDLLSLYNELFDTYRSGAMLLHYLYNLVPNEDELTFTHCLNSALLAGTFADWVNMSDEDKNNLILASFYYDIGKLKLPYELLWKPGKLSAEEFEMIKKHPVIGYAMIKNIPLNQTIKNAVIMHHERMDGSGYPYHMKGNGIEITARYLAIIDTYIAMASPRSYRNALAPLQILEIYEKDMYKYDISLLIPVMKRIGDAQIGSTVQLNDESIWEVFIMHPDHLSRPILKDEDNRILNLMEHPELTILRNL